jgi:hypothetical protein
MARPINARLFVGKNFPQSDDASSFFHLVQVPCQKTSVITGLEIDMNLEVREGGGGLAKDIGW